MYKPGVQVAHAIVAAVLVAVVAGCGSSSSGQNVRPSLANLIANGSVVVAARGVGTEDLGTFAVNSTPVDIDVQGTCVGTGDVRVVVDTGNDPITGNAACVSRSDNGSLAAGTTINYASISDHHVRIRVSADLRTQWSITVSTPNA